MRVMIVSLEELGLEAGSTLDGIFQHIQGTQLKPDNDFPKGINLRKVDDDLRLRGCAGDSARRFPGDALFPLTSGR